MRSFDRLKHSLTRGAQCSAKRRLFAAVLVAALTLSSTAMAAEYTDRATVKKVQQALNDAGYECGTPDGSRGRKTKTAIESFQKDKGLEVTGTVDDALWEALGLYEAKEANIRFDDPSLPVLDRDYCVKHPNMWAGCVFYDAMLKLTGAGILEADPMRSEYPLKKNLKGAFPMIFKNKSEGKKLTDKGFRLGPGRYIICRENNRTSYSDEKVSQIHGFLPYKLLDSGVLGYANLKGDTSEILESAVDTSRLTWDIDACDYIIIMDGYKSLSDEDYYIYDVDRFGMTMIVFVIDAREKTCLHIECVSTDLPGSPTHDNVGQKDFPSAEAYIAKLLKG